MVHVAQRSQALWSGLKKLVPRAGGTFISKGGVLFSAAIAFYAMLSAAPLLVIAVAIAGQWFGQEAAQGELIRRLKEPLGADAAILVSRLLQQTDEAEKGGWAASLLSGAVILFGASRLFAQLQDALNFIWGVQIRTGRGIRKAAGLLMRKRLLSFLMVVASGLMLGVVLLANTALSAVHSALGELVAFSEVWRVMEFSVSLGVLGFMCALTFQLLPDVRLAWRDVWLGAFVTAFLLSAGTLLISLYLGYVSPSSTYGAAGSMVLLLLWVYYSAHIFFFGAVFTREWAHEYGRGVRPEPWAEWSRSSSEAGA